MSNNISNEKILKIVDTFDECAMMYFDGTTDELYENTDITNYNVERPHTNFFECLLKCVGYFLDGDELKVDEEKVEEQIKQKLDDLKKYLNEVLQATLEPIRKRRKEFEKSKAGVYKILDEGTKNARNIAKVTLSNVKAAMGIDYNKSLFNKEG